MARAVVVPLALLLSLATGCVTQRMWELRGELLGPKEPPPGPLRVDRAIRDGRGAVHLLVTVVGGRQHHLVVQRERPVERGADWPHAGRTESAAVLADPSPLPEGAPLATWVDDGQPPPPPAAPTAPTALDPPATPGPAPARVELYGDRFELVHTDGRRELLAYLPPHRRPWAAAHDDDVTARDVGAALLCAAATPFTFVADVAVIVLGPLWYPFYALRP